MKLTNKQIDKFIKSLWAYRDTPKFYRTDHTSNISIGPLLVTTDLRNQTKLIYIYGSRDYLTEDGIEYLEKQLRKHFDKELKIDITANIAIK